MNAWLLAAALAVAPPPHAEELPAAPSPYSDEAERRLGDSLGAAAAEALVRRAPGRALLARLAGPGGRDALPPVVVEDLGAEAAEYDCRRRALVVDRQTLMAAVADGVAAPRRGALEAALASRPTLIAYLNARPDAVAAFAAANDVLLVHELTHAWQDRREPVMRAMARGDLPAAVIVDYEEEAALTKDLYLLDKLGNAPESVPDDAELADARRLLADAASWRRALRAAYAAASPEAMSLEAVAALARGGGPPRARRELARAAAAQRRRVARLLAQAAALRSAAPALLARYYLGRARRERRSVDARVEAEKAADCAARSGDAALLARARAAARAISLLYDAP